MHALPAWLISGLSNFQTAVVQKSTVEESGDPLLRHDMAHEEPSSQPTDLIEPWLLRSPFIAQVLGAEPSQLSHGLVVRLHTTLKSSGALKQKSEVW